MDIIEAREILVSLPLSEECQPFGDDVAVYKVGGKMFACVSFERPDFMAVKCDPDRAEQLRDRYPEITAAWHFNKRHWNDIRITTMDDDIVRREIIHSYMTVIRTNVTPKALREEILAVAAEAGIKDTATLEL